MTCVNQNSIVACVMPKCRNYALNTVHQLSIYCKTYVQGR